MHRSLIKMIDRVFRVPSVKANELLQRKMQALLQKNCDELPYVIKDCLERAVESQHDGLSFFCGAALPSGDQETSCSKGMPVEMDSRFVVM